MKTLPLICLLAATGRVLAADATISHLDPPQAHVLLVKTPGLELTIDPQQGGRIASLKDKQFGGGTSPKEANLFQDIPLEQKWPGELLSKPYELLDARVESDAVVVSLRGTVEGQYRGNSFPAMEGVTVTKTYRIDLQRPHIEVAYQIANPTKKTRTMGLWIQNILQMGETGADDIASRPSVAGVTRFPMMEQPVGWGWRNWADMTDGWIGVVDPGTGHSGVFSMEYDSIQALYQAGPSSTSEWMYHPVTLQPGGEWKTRVSLDFAKARPAVVASAPDFLLSADLSSDEKAVEFDRALPGAASASKPSLIARFRDIKTEKVVETEIPLPAGSSSLALPAGIKPPFFLSGVVRDGGKDVAVVEEFFGGGHYPQNEPLPGYPPLWRATARAQQILVNIPENADFAADAGRKILAIHGPLALDRAWVEGLRAAGYEVSAAYEQFTGTEAGFTNLPSSYEGWLAQRTIVCDNADLGILNPTQRFNLGFFLKKGGRIIALGGTASAQVAWSQSPLAAAKAPASAVPFGMVFLPGKTDDGVTSLGTTWLDAKNAPASTFTTKAGVGQVIGLGASQCGLPAAALAVRQEAVITSILKVLPKP
jgi:hypothetical protein